MTSHIPTTNQAVTRPDYPGKVDSVKWNKIYLRGVNNEYGAVLDHFEWAKLYREIFHGTKSAIDPNAKFIKAKYCTVWNDDFTPHTTSNYNEGRSVYAYRLNDEPNNRPHVFGIKYSHAGSKLMWSAIEHEFMNYVNNGFIVKECDPNTGKLTPVWGLLYICRIGADRRAGQKINLEVGPNGKHSNPRIIGNKSDLLLNGKHPHVKNCSLPHGALLKTHGFEECVHIALTQTPQLSHKSHLRTAGGMAHYYEKVSPLTIVLNRKYLYKCDGFHAFFSGTGKDAALTLHSVETQENPLSVALFTRLYNEGTSLASYQYRSPLSCFGAGKAPNKFTLIYNGLYSMMEMQPLVSLQTNHIHQMDDPLYIRCVQNLWLSINCWLCAIGRIHSSCANSRLFQCNYIQTVFNEFTDLLDQIDNELDCEIRYIKEHCHEMNDVNDIDRQVNQVLDKSNPVIASMNNSDAVVTTKIIGDDSDNDSDTDLGSDERYQPPTSVSSDDMSDDEEVSADTCTDEIHFESTPETGDTVSAEDKAQILKYQQLQEKIRSIKNKSNVYLMLEMLHVDGYIAPMLIGDCGNFENGLREPKKIWTKGDKRFDEINNVKHLENIKKKTLWDDWWSRGMKCHTVQEQDSWCQLLPLPIKSCMWC